MDRFGSSSKTTDGKNVQGRPAQETHKTRGDATTEQTPPASGPIRRQKVHFTANGSFHSSEGKSAFVQSPSDQAAPTAQPSPASGDVWQKMAYYAKESAKIAGSALFYTTAVTAALGSTIRPALAEGRYNNDRYHPASHYNRYPPAPHYDRYHPEPHYDRYYPEPHYDRYYPAPSYAPSMRDDRDPWQSEREPRSWSESRRGSSSIDSASGYMGRDHDEFSLMVRRGDHEFAKPTRKELMFLLQDEKFPKYLRVLCEKPQDFVNLLKNDAFLDLIDPVYQSKGVLNFMHHLCENKKDRKVFLTLREQVFNSLSQHQVETLLNRFVKREGQPNQKMGKQIALSMILGAAILAVYKRWMKKPVAAEKMSLLQSDNQSKKLEGEGSVERKVGNYRLDELLGKGNFGEVHLGKHVKTSQRAAIKMLQSQADSQEREKFFLEAMIHSPLKHLHIIEVYEHNIDKEGDLYIAMQYASGGTLLDRHPQGSCVPLEKIISYMKQIANALDYIHQNNVIHLDIKPANILLSKKDGDHILISDFGLARYKWNPGALSAEGEIAGTIAYMAPEQRLGNPCPASDQYTVGVMVYEWLIGNLPFGSDAREIDNYHKHRKPPESLMNYKEKIPNISPEIDKVVRTALNTNPTERYRSVGEFATKLEEAYQRALLPKKPKRKMFLLRR